MTFDDIQILQQRFLRGPNFWTYRSAVEAWLDIGELEKFPSNTIPGFVDRWQSPRNQHQRRLQSGFQGAARRYWHGQFA